jgi:hypothetical protein
MRPILNPNGAGAREDSSSFVHEGAFCFCAAAIKAKDQFHGEKDKRVRIERHALIGLTAED